jgi:Uma2 family endonuclease
VLGRNPDTVLAPDLAFVRHDRLLDHPDDGFLLVPPDLVAEVLDPWDSEHWIEQKVRIYLGAGVEQIWIVDPGRRELIAHRRDHSMAHYRNDDIVPGGNMLAGFDLRLGDIFE